MALVALWRGVPVLTAASASQHSDNQMRRRRESLVVAGPVIPAVIAAVRCDVLGLGMGGNP